ncbi:noroxomaritidine synthase 1-like [Hordeum vulgare subsp. vulgare]|uniref:noroxomaritidine synthase 1-like n=1 Tax=Hordeum vulgare subsp. vulgare TaxID=112509 RepID=UPI000B47AF82|nr:noroxomaritidine synthase 1-like [Hordeum vulgare subsp. vulgare]
MSMQHKPKAQASPHTLLTTMSTMSFSQELLISTLAIILVSMYTLYLRSSRSKGPAVLPTNWPIVGVLPSLVANLHNLHDYLAVVLAGSGHNFRATGPPGTGMRFFVTCDPANVRHIFTSNHANFPKGAEFAAIFDIAGGSFFTTEGEPWRRQRTRAQRVLSNPRLVATMTACCLDKVENGLLPVLMHMATTATPFDLQALTTRLVFDITAAPLFGVDPGLLSSDMPPMDAAVAMDTVMEVALFRHIVPATGWKVMRRLNIGPERKLAAAHTVLRGFVAEMMERRKMKEHAAAGDEEAPSSVDILSSYIDDPDYQQNDGLLHATLINYMIAGRDTISTALTWVFYNLAQNPRVMSVIRNELSPIASRKAASDSSSTMVIFEPEETKSLVYMRAALQESLRLHPPVPIERKTAVASDVMPSGHVVHAGDTLLISLHSMGRMEDVWGKDCREYNPDRWLSEDGKKLRYVPSHKFLAFSSGPRICLGKDISFMQMNTIVAAMVWNFDVELVDGLKVQPEMSCVLRMKNGLMVKLKKREM